MVIFFCSFLTLRSHDSGHPITSFDDHKLHHEEVIFNAYVFAPHLFSLSLCLPFILKPTTLFLPSLSTIRPHLTSSGFLPLRRSTSVSTKRMMANIKSENSPITDQRYKHSLKICHDEESDGIRLQASVQSGEIKRCAFSPLPYPSCPYFRPFPSFLLSSTFDPLPLLFSSPSLMSPSPNQYPPH